MKHIITMAAAVVLMVGVTHAEQAHWGLEETFGYMITPNITYLTADQYESKLDVFSHADETPRPVLLYIHGGGWVGGQKEQYMLLFLPYLKIGFSIVNVEYRLARHALAPAAVEDARCALRWTIQNAARFNLDPDRIVVSGHSAGGHLSLTTGMLTAAAGLDHRCPLRSPDPNAGRADTYLPEMPVAAIINWFGITDVADLVEGENSKSYAVAWLGGMPNWKAVADRVSPIYMVRDDLPPILTLHGDADKIVPYEHAIRLHKKLDKSGDQHRLFTIKGGNHGRFSLAEQRDAMTEIHDFLVANGILSE